VEGKGAGLKAFGEAHPGDPVAGYLAMLSLPVKDGAEGWERWVKAHFFKKDRILETLHAELAYGFFETSSQCAVAVIGTWMGRLDPERFAGEPGPGESSQPQQLIPRLFAEYVEAIPEENPPKPALLLKPLQASLSNKTSS